MAILDPNLSQFGSRLRQANQGYKANTILILYYYCFKYVR